MSIVRATSDGPLSPPSGDAFQNAILRMLRAAFPPAALDLDEAHASGDQAMKDAIAALDSASPDQLLLAARYFLATIRALDRLVGSHDDDARQQVSRLRRDARRACSSLFRLQGGRAGYRTKQRIPPAIEQAVNAIVAQAFPLASQQIEPNTDAQLPAAGLMNAPIQEVSPRRFGRKPPGH